MSSSVKYSGATCSKSLQSASKSFKLEKKISAIAAKIYIDTFPMTAAVSLRVMRFMREKEIGKSFFLREKEASASSNTQRKAVVKSN